MIIKIGQPDPAVALAQARSVMVISPLQGILTLGEEEWGKVLAYRDTASWAEKVVIDSAKIGGAIARISRFLAI